MLHRRRWSAQELVGPTIPAGVTARAHGVRRRPRRPPTGLVGVMADTVRRRYVPPDRSGWFKSVADLQTELPTCELKTLARGQFRLITSCCRRAAEVAAAWPSWWARTCHPFSDR